MISTNARKYLSMNQKNKIVYNKEMFYLPPHRKHLMKWEFLL